MARSRSDSAPTPEDIYQAYPRHIGKQAAIKAIKIALRNIDPNFLLDRVREYAECCDRNIAAGTMDRCYIPYPASWIRAGRYDDDPGEWVREPRKDEKQVAFEQRRAAEDAMLNDERERRAASEIGWWRERYPGLLARAEKMFPDRYRQVRWMKLERDGK